jgi:8-oxo-dGTP pyrophosphatase MutT (NUDIX family)
MKETGVIFALIRGTQILMQQRDGNCPKYPFQWCIPGGGREDGETYEAALVREVKEEYGLDISLSQCHFLMNYHDDTSKVYVCHIASTEQPVLGEGLAMQWMSLDEIAQLELGFNQAGIIPALRATLARA